MAAGAVNTMRQLGYALGIAALGAICQSQISDVLRAHHVTAPTSLAVRLVGGQAQAVLAHAPGPARVHLDAAIHAAFASGLNSDLLVGGAIGIAAAMLVVATVRGRAGVAAAQPAVPVREPA
jgi:hypothetical protein